MAASTVLINLCENLNFKSIKKQLKRNDDLNALLFLEAAFPEPRLLGHCLNIEDISEIDCEQMFR